MFGTLAYCSPEILLGLQHNMKTDVWSLGVVIYELLSGKFPFVGDERGATKKNITTATLNLNTVRWSSISSEAIDLIKKMLSLDEDSRISAS
jgi:serine/threonine protein kinase